MGLYNEEVITLTNPFDYGIGRSGRLYLFERNCFEWIICLVFGNIWFRERLNNKKHIIYYIN